MYVGGFPAPAFCHSCGEPFPWTRSRIEAAKELIDGVGSLDQAEKQKLADSLTDLVADTPRTAVAAGRFRQFLTKVGPVAAKAFQDILISIMTEAARKQIWG